METTNYNFEVTNMEPFYVKNDRHEQELISLNAWDSERLRATIPGNYIKSQPTMVKQFLRYLTEDGRIISPCFPPPRQTCFALKPAFPNTLPKEARDDKDPSLFEGIQLTLPVTSRETVTCPTDEEALYKKILDDIHEFAWKIYVYEASLPKDDKDKRAIENPSLPKRRIPPASASAFLAAKQDEDPLCALKPQYDMQNKVVDKVTVMDKTGKNAIKDPTKPLVSNIKLVTYGKGHNMECKTYVYGPGNVQDKTGYKYINTLCEVESALNADSIYWGNHGSKPWGASVQIKAIDINVTPKLLGGDKPRLLGRNEAPLPEVEEVDEQQTIADDGTAAEFTSPDDPDDAPQSTQDTLASLVAEQKDPEPEPEPEEPKPKQTKPPTKRITRK